MFPELAVNVSLISKQFECFLNLLFVLIKLVCFKNLMPKIFVTLYVVNVKLFSIKDVQNLSLNAQN